MSTEASTPSGTPVPQVVEVEGGVSLTGAVRVPGDKSVSHRAMLLGALAEGRSVVRGCSDGEDVAQTRAAVIALGASVDPVGPGEWVVCGGRHRLAPPVSPIDCGNSGTTMRLLLGVLSGLEGATTVTGDRSLSRRPMDRVAVPLRRMGARIVGVGERCTPPLDVRGGLLQGIRWEPPMASAQVKSAVLLAGLDASGETVVHEPVPTRAHTEEMLVAAGADISVDRSGGGCTIVVRRSALRPTDVDIPGDPSQAAFWVVAGTVVPGSAVEVGPVYAGPARTGYLDVLDRMGARVTRVPTANGIALEVRSAELRATDVHAAEIPALDEVPVLAVAAACATGTTTFHDVGELRVKESDRMVAVRDLVGAFGAAAEIRGECLVVHGAGPGGLRAGSVEVTGDHRIAMAAAVGGLVARGTTVVTGFATVATSYPGFLGHLAGLGGRAEAATAPSRP